MCGIIGYCGPQDVAPLLLDGLKRLEYRGYDSVGVAVGGPDGIHVVKDAGFVDDLPVAGSSVDGSGSWGVGHTRWATHGAPTRDNAHPHVGCRGEITLVHNGIVENHLELRDALEAKGHEFVSETDTEVVAHLLEELYQGDLEEAVTAAVDQLEGSYAIVAMHAGEPDALVAARYRSPLVVGVGDGEHLVASDVTPLLDHTREVVYLEDGDVARITPGSLTVRNGGKPRTVTPEEVAWDVEDAEKGGYEHFMLKEIHEQPRAIHEVLQGRVGRVATDLGLQGSLGPEDLSEVERVLVLAMGTSHNAGLVGGRAIEAWAGLPVEHHLASEFRHGDLLPDERTLVVAVSQSGETADTLEALRRAKGGGAPVLAFTNVAGSSLTRVADGVLHLRAGPEISVAATKSFTNQLVAFHLLALHLGALRGHLTAPELEPLVKQVRGLPRAVQKVLEHRGVLEELGREVAEHDHAFYLGRHVNVGTALEGALKLKEVSYVHAEGYAAGELKHGPLALLTPGLPVVGIVGPDDTRGVMLGNLGEVRAREARVIAVVAEGDEEVGKIATDVVEVPNVHPLLFPVPASVALQLVAYHAARARDLPIDKPRNLAKSVTVE